MTAMRRYATLLAAVVAVTPAIAQSPTEGWRTYKDTKARFVFLYPAEFGNPSPGTDDGFRNRSAAIRFSEFSAGVHGLRIILGGEAVLTAGPPRLDLQAAGGLYDPITLQIFPAQIATVVQSALPVLTAAAFCDAIGRDQHIDPADTRLSALTPDQRKVIPSVDRMGNVAPKILRCDLSGATVTFDKESKSDPAGANRHIYGAVRFLPQPYSTFQLIRGSADAPPTTLLNQITTVVNSWKSGSN